MMKFNRHTFARWAAGVVLCLGVTASFAHAASVRCHLFWSTGTLSFEQCARLRSEGPFSADLGAGTKTELAVGDVALDLDYAGGQPLRLSLQPLKTVDAQPVKAGDIRFDPEASDVFIVVTSSPDGKRFKCVSYDVTAKKVPNGTALFINTGSKPIALKTIATEAVLAPGASRRVDISKVTDYAMPVMTAAMGDEEEDWKPFFSSVNVVYPEHRILFVATEGDEETGWMLHRIPLPQL